MAVACKRCGVVKLLLHLVGLHFIYVYDARSNTHQILKLTLFWKLTSCNLTDEKAYRRFRATWCIYIYQAYFNLSGKQTSPTILYVHPLTRSSDDAVLHR